MPCISDFVSGALNKLKYSRTPSITPQQEKNGKYYLYLFKWKFLTYFDLIKSNIIFNGDFVLCCDIANTLDNEPKIVGKNFF